MPSKPTISKKEYDRVNLFIKWLEGRETKTEIDRLATLTGYKPLTLKLVNRGSKPLSDQMALKLLPHVPRPRSKKYLDDFRVPPLELFESIAEHKWEELQCKSMTWEQMWTQWFLHMHTTDEDFKDYDIWMVGGRLNPTEKVAYAEMYYRRKNWTGWNRCQLGVETVGEWHSNLFDWQYSAKTPLPANAFQIHNPNWKNYPDAKARDLHLEAFGSHFGYYFDLTENGWKAWEQFVGDAARIQGYRTDDSLRHSEEYYKLLKSWKANLNKQQLAEYLFIAIGPDSIDHYVKMPVSWKIKYLICPSKKILQRWATKYKITDFIPVTLDSKPKLLEKALADSKSLFIWYHPEKLHEQWTKNDGKNSGLTLSHGDLVDFDLQCCKSTVPRVKGDKGLLSKT